MTDHAVRWDADVDHLTREEIPAVLGRIEEIRARLWLKMSEAGTPLDESRVRKNFADALRGVGLAGFRVYDLRHTFASLLLAQGAPITYVAAQLGHSKPTTTLQWYAHWVATGHERFVDGLAGPKTAKRATRTPATKTFGHRLGTKRTSGASGVPETPDCVGGPSRTRTLDPLIKRRLGLVSLFVLSHHKSAVYAM